METGAQKCDQIASSGPVLDSFMQDYSALPNQFVVLTELMPTWMDAS